AGLALVLVVAAGLLAHRPLSRVPENTLKFAVGLLLVSFGTFWSAEGVGVEWPGADAMLLGLLAGYALLSWALVLALRGRSPPARPLAPAPCCRIGRVGALVWSSSAAAASRMPPNNGGRGETSTGRSRIPAQPGTPHDSSQGDRAQYGGQALRDERRVGAVGQD